MHSPKVQNPPLRRHEGGQLASTRHPPRGPARRRSYSSGANCRRDVLSGAVPASGRTVGGPMSHRSGAVAVAGRRWSAHPEPDGADAARPTTRIQIRTASHPEEQRIPAAAAQLGVRGLRGCRRWTVCHLEGLLSAADVARRCAELLGGGSGRSPRLTRWRWSSTGTGRSRRWPGIWVSARRIWGTGSVRPASIAVIGRS